MMVVPIGDHRHSSSLVGSSLQSKGYSIWHEPQAELLGPSTADGTDHKYKSQLFHMFTITVLKDRHLVHWCYANSVLSVNN